MWAIWGATSMPTTTTISPFLGAGAIPPRRPLFAIAPGVVSLNYASDQRQLRLSCASDVG